ncbi:MAG: SPOR domain-containing protein [Bacteroidetes bacterium]|nr:SPOR domain-containing protein [Bacteroidota bacterium]
MKIAVYIGDLLYEYECVVIPGLGGFLSRDYPASIHPVKHYFSPPHREIVFNPWLRANDGLLLNHIALHEKLPYHEAKSRLDRFVLKCLSALAEGKRINFRNVGTIYYDKDQQIVFEPDTHQNYLPDAFGLSGFVSPPVRRDESFANEPVFARPARRTPEAPPPPASPKIKNAPRKPMVASRRPSALRRQLLILGATTAAMLAGAAYMNKNLVAGYYQQYVGQASMLPLFYASPGEYLLMHIDRLPKDMLLITNEMPKPDEEHDKLRKASDNLLPAQPYRPEMSPEVSHPADKPDDNADTGSDFTVKMGYTLPVDAVTGIKEAAAPEPVQEIISQAVAQPESEVAQVVPTQVAGIEDNELRGFFIVAGAFREKVNAEKLVSELRARGFEASITGRTGGGLWRVTYERHNNRQAALNRLSQIKQTVDNQAWLLVI